MHVAVISDLHLGARDAPDSFRHDDAEFLGFLRFLESNFEKIVLLGDVWETLTGPLPGSPAAELERARRGHPEIARRFRGHEYTYVHGNHDLIAGRVDHAPEELSLTADGVRLVFTHGHQTDSLARFWSEIGVWLGGWIRRAGFAPLYELFAWLDSKRTDISADPARCPFQRWAVGLAKLRTADVVVTGHTHFAARAEHGQRLFLNSGSCSEGKFSYLSLDTRRGQYRVHDSW
jgi:predicted phosphodiesterase